MFPKDWMRRRSTSSSESLRCTVERVSSSYYFKSAISSSASLSCLLSSLFSWIKSYFSRRIVSTRSWLSRAWPSRCSLSWEYFWYRSSFCAHSRRYLALKSTRSAFSRDRECVSFSLKARHCFTSSNSSTFLENMSVMIRICLDRLWFSFIRISWYLKFLSCSSLTFSAASSKVSRSSSRPFSDCYRWSTTWFFSISIFS